MQILDIDRPAMRSSDFTTNRQAQSSTKVTPMLSTPKAIEHA
jgi:hypothetical protein